MNNEKQERSTWLIYSLALHGLAILALLISLNETNLLQPQQKQAQVILADEKKELRERFKNKEKNGTKPLDQSTFTVPTPVMYYGKELDPDKKPGTPTKKATPSQHYSLEESAPSIPKKTTDSTKETPSPESKTEEIAQEGLATPLKEIPVTTESGTLLAPIIDPTINKKKPRERSTIPKAQSRTLNNTPETKKLTLADIFKKSPTISEDTQIVGEGSGQPIVIKEGDMKYYSVWTKFLHHLNQTAKFNRVKKQVPLKEWIKTGQLKKDLYCGITVTKEGKVLAIDIISSSGFKPFDDTCVHDIWASSPFPPLPESMGKERARFEVRSHL